MQLGRRNNFSGNFPTSTALLGVGVRDSCGGRACVEGSTTEELKNSSPSFLASPQNSAHLDPGVESSRATLGENPLDHREGVCLFRRGHDLRQHHLRERTISAPSIYDIATFSRELKRAARNRWIRKYSHASATIATSLGRSWEAQRDPNLSRKRGRPLTHEGW